MLSVVTLVRNRNRMLRDFLRAWALQDLAELEIVVVRAGGDEDPTEDTTHVPTLTVRHLSLPAALDDESIAYAHARNAGASAARGDRLVFCDADTMPTEGCARLLHDALGDHDALLTGDVRYLPPGVDLSRPPDELAALARPNAGRPSPSAQAGSVDLTLRHELVWGLCMGVRTSTFRDVGGFDESFCGYAGEDTDLATAIGRSGRRAGIVGGAVVLHQHHDSFEPPLHQLRATVANAQRYRDKWGIWPMEGWLERFASLGLVEWRDDVAEVIRDPTPDEIEAHRCSVAAPFR